MIENFFRNIGVRFLRSMPGAAEEIYQKATIKGIRDVICYNQGKLADYAFVAGQKHKRLKDELLQFRSLTPQDSLEGINAIRVLHDDLSSYLDLEFRRISEANFIYLLNFFRHRCPKDKYPRACIKAKESDRIITLARDRICDASGNEDFSVNDNTAFIRINETGRYYICRDIPLGVKQSTYRNARIYESSVRRTYSSPNWIKAFEIRALGKSDYKWQHCWRRIQAPTPSMSDDLPSPETCYKSTLVIPMTLRNSDNWLSPEFRTHFHIEREPQKASFGFLCLDHQFTGFFNEREDVDIGYIFADILSLYLIKRLTYTTYSKTFNEALTLIYPNGVN